jgi:hypothetical protein
MGSYMNRTLLYLLLFLICQPANSQSVEDALENVRQTTLTSIEALWDLGSILITVELDGKRAGIVAKQRSRPESRDRDQVIVAYWMAPGAKDEKIIKPQSRSEMHLIKALQSVADVTPDENQKADLELFIKLIKNRNTPWPGFDGWRSIHKASS